MPALTRQKIKKVLPRFPLLAGEVDSWLDGVGYCTDVSATILASAQSDLIAAWKGRNGTILPQSDSAHRLALRLDSANGRQSIAPQLAAATYYGFTGDNLSLDRRACTLWAVVRPVSCGIDDMALFNVGAGLTDMLVDMVGMSASGPGTIRLFGVTGANTTSRLYCDPILITVSCGASSIILTVDDVTYTTGSAFGSGTVTGGTLLYRSDPGYKFDAEIHAMGIINRAWAADDPDRNALKAWSYPRFRRAVITKQMAVQGDSLSEGQNTTLGKNWPCTAVDKYLGAGWRLWNQAVSGTSCQAVAALITSGTTAIFDGSLTKNIYTHFLGTNDLGVLGRSAAQLLTDTDTCLTAVRAAGFQTNVATIPDRTGSVNWDVIKDAQRTIFNTAIRAGGSLASKVDKLTDVSANAMLDDPNNTTYRSTDFLHYKQAGSDLLANVFGASIASM